LVVSGLPKKVKDELKTPCNQAIWLALSRVKFSNLKKPNFFYSATVTVPKYWLVETSALSVADWKNKYLN
jgi:hypothetical protein